MDAIFSSKNVEEVKQIDREKNEIYFQPFTNTTFKTITPKIGTVLKVVKAKLEAGKPSLLIKPTDTDVLPEEYKSLFQEVSDFPLKDQTKYSTIFDCSNFIHYVKNQEELNSLNSVKAIEQEKIKSLVDTLKEKGALIILADFIFLKQLPLGIKQALGENFLTKLFMKLYIIEKNPLIGLFFIQLMSSSTTPVDPYKEKILAYEIYDDLEITKPISYTLDNMSKSITYMYEMYQYQDYLQKLHPGQIFPINIKENFYSDNVECVVTVIDSNIQEIIDLKNCMSIIVGKGFTNEFKYLTKEGYVALCRQVKASRIILIRPGPFNYDDINELRARMNTYITLFTYSNCENKSIPLLLMRENMEFTKIDDSKGGMVRDCFDLKKKLNTRRLIPILNPNDSQCEIKLTLTSKTKIKQDQNKQYIPLITEEKYASKNLSFCFNDKEVVDFYDKTVLCGLYFANFEKFPSENLNVLILGAGAGSIGYYMNKILLGKVNIDSVEKDIEVTKVGKKYFALNDYDNKKSNIKWHFEEAKKFVMNSTKENYYDLVVMDIKNYNILEGISPNPEFFEEDFLKKLTTLMKPKAMYILNMMGRSYQKYYAGFVSLQKSFGNIFLLDSNDDLNKIHFCFKNKNGEEYYKTVYEHNVEILAKKDIVDNTLIDEEHKRILRKVIDTDKFEELLKFNSKS